MEARNHGVSSLPHVLLEGPANKMKRRNLIPSLGLIGAFVSCMPMMALGLLALLGASSASAVHTGMSGMSQPTGHPGILGAMASVLDPVAQPLLLGSLLLVVISARSRGYGVFGLTALLSGAAYVFMYVLDLGVLSWASLGLLAALFIGLAVHERRAMRCGIAGAARQVASPPSA